MWTKEGRIAVHQIVTRQRDVLNLTVRLAKAASGTADEDKVLSDLTECDFVGYAGIVNPAWDVPTINGSDQAEGKSSLLTWTAGSPSFVTQTITHVYLEMSFTGGSPKLLWVKALSPTATLGATGEEFKRYIDLFADDIAALD